VQEGYLSMKSLFSFVKWFAVIPRLCENICISCPFLGYWRFSPARSTRCDKVAENSVGSGMAVFRKPLVSSSHSLKCENWRPYVVAADDSKHSILSCFVRTGIITIPRLLVLERTISSLHINRFYRKLWLYSLRRRKIHSVVSHIPNEYTFRISTSLFGLIIFEDWCSTFLRNFEDCVINNTA
jgi:hypothetical protein